MANDGFATRLISLFCLVIGALGAQSARTPPSDSPSPSRSQGAPAPAPRKDIPAIAKGADGSVVSIIMSDKDGKPLAQGSGFVVREDGVVITNYHVISEGSSAIVKLPDGAFYQVDGVLASDKRRDIALIKLHGESFKTVALGNSDQVRVGEQVVAIGNPLSLESSVSNGIISGIRTIQEEGGKFLQVTAPISPGSSGGPLFNMSGEVIGITTLYLKGGENLNFAIPINDARALLPNQSVKLQNLPNEAHPPTDQADDTAPNVGTPAQEKACSEQADHTFKGRGAAFADFYTSHFNPKLGVCFVKTTRLPAQPLGPGSSGVVDITIDDAFEGSTYGEYFRTTLNGQVVSLRCYARPSRQSDEITCHSWEEFDKLALKYFGITP